jgi:hypothetical protein
LRQRGAINGVTTYKGIFNKTANVYLSKSAFISKPQLYMTMHHEYMHSYFFSNNIRVIDGGHNIIRSWHAAQLLKWSPKLFQLSSNYFQFLNSFGTDLFSKYGFKTINYVP